MANGRSFGERSLRRGPRSPDPADPAPGPSQQSVARLADRVRFDRRAADGTLRLSAFRRGTTLPLLYYTRDRRGRRPVGPSTLTGIGPRGEWLLRTRLVALSSLATAALVRAVGV